MNDKLIVFKEKMAEKWITHNGSLWKKKKVEKTTNPNELNNKNHINIIYLQKPMTWEETITINKKKMRDIRITALKNYLESSIWNLNKAIDLYKELKNKTEYWEGKSTIDFNFKNWNKLKKVNGHITKYFNELLEIKRSLENEKN